MKPLPLTDGCFLIDNSSLETLQTCSQAFEYNNIEKRKASTSKASLDFGSAIHLALEYRYKTFKDQPITTEGIQEQARILDEFFKENPVDEFESRNCNFACDLMKRYNQKYLTEPFNVLLDKDGKVLCEVPLAIPLFTTKYKGSPLEVIFTGKIDLPISMQSKICIMDNKTSSMFFGPQKFCLEQQSANQFRGYAWGFEKATGQTVDMFMVNGIPTKQPPAKPKNGLDGWYSEWFVRDITHLALYPNWREEWFSATCERVDYILWCHERGVFPQNGRFVKACENYGGCQYKDVCNSHPTKRAEMLASTMYQDNTWSPLQRKNT